MYKYMLATSIFCLSLIVGNYNALASQPASGSSIHDSDHAAQASNVAKGKIATQTSTSVRPDEHIKRR